MSKKKPQMGTFGDTLVDFLEMAAKSYGSRDALLFKPGFRYHRWSYRDVWESAGRVATLLQGAASARATGCSSGPLTAPTGCSPSSAPSAPAPWPCPST